MDSHKKENDQIITETEYLLTGNDVANILKVSRSFAYLLMKRGEIPSLRLGRSIRVRPVDLDNFITSRVSVIGIEDTNN